MKEIIGDFIGKIFNPPEVTKKKADIKYELQVKFDKCIHMKEYLNSWMWTNYEKPTMQKQMEADISRLIRDGLDLNEVQLKSIIAGLRVHVNKLSEMRFIIDEGEKAGIKLERMA